MFKCKVWWGSPTTFKIATNHLESQLHGALDLPRLPVAEEDDERDDERDQESER